MSEIQAKYLITVQLYLLSFGLCYVLRNKMC